MKSGEKLMRLISRMMREILEDVANGVVPIDCPSFSALHVHVDANCYGGLCDADPEKPDPSNIDAQWEGDQTDCDYHECAQGTVDAWIKGGGLRFGGMDP